MVLRNGEEAVERRLEQIVHGAVLNMQQVIDELVLLWPHLLLVKVSTGVPQLL